MSTPLIMFLAFIAITLGITYWAARRSSGSSAYFAAGRRITGWQNGIAVAGDYMSAASFLGIAGIIAFQGYDGFLYSVGWLVAYLTVLLVVAEPLGYALEPHQGRLRRVVPRREGGPDGAYIDPRAGFPRRLHLSGLICRSAPGSSRG